MSSLQVSDLDAVAAFYVEVVGLQVSDSGTGAGRPGTPRITFLSWDPVSINHQLALLEVLRAPSTTKNMNHLAFEVDSLDELRTVWRRMNDDGRAGALMARDRRPVTAFMGDQWSIRFADPEGNGIEIYARTPWDAPAAAKPYSLMPTVMFDPFDIDAADDDLVAWGVAQLEALGIEHWPRGQRPWSSSVVHRIP